MMEREYVPVPQKPVISNYWLESGDFNRAEFNACDEEGNKLQAIILKINGKSSKTLNLFLNGKKHAKAYYTVFNKRPIIYARLIKTCDLIIIKSKSESEIEVANVVSGWPFYNILVMQSIIS